MSIQAERKKQGITQSQLAEQLGVRQSAVAMWETGASKPATDKLIPLANILKCSVDELLRD